MYILQAVSASVLVFILAGGQAIAQNAQAPRPRKGAAARKLGANLDLLLTRYAMYGFSGTVLVARNGRIVLNKGYGLADRERRIPNNVDTIFDIGSITKTFTAAAILQLEMGGKLKTSDPIGIYLGEFPQDKTGITIHHLLTHTAGLRLDAGDAGITPSDDRETFVLKAKASTLLSVPGEKYSYSNLGYALLAIVIERVSGQSWQGYLKEHLIKPAGLSRTFLWGDKIKNQSQFARGYTELPEEEARLEEPLKQARPDSYMWGSKYAVGAGGVMMTVGDLHKWWLALRSGRILSAAARQKMFTPQAGGQGYGWNIRGEQNKITRIHRGGLLRSFQFMLAYYPNEDTVLIYDLNKLVVSEGSPFWAIVGWSNMERVITGKDYTPPPAVTSLSPTALRRYAGEYQLPSGGKFVVWENKGSLFTGAEGQDAVNLLAYAHQALPAFQDEINKLGVGVVEWLKEGDLAQVTKAGALSEKEAAELGRKWEAWMGNIGGLRSHQFLGSAQGSRGFVRTFVRLGGVKGTVVIRLLWDWDKRKLVAWGDDIPLPAVTKFWPEAETSFVTFDFNTSKSLRLMFDISPDNGVRGLIAPRPDGERGVYARKVQ